MTWSLDGAAGDRITAGGVLTTAAPGNRELRVRATDDTGAKGLVTGGSTVSGYTVLTDPPTGPHPVAAGTTSLNLTGLEPGTAYLVSVYATNAGGGTSAPGTASLTIGARPSGCPVALAFGAATRCTLSRAGQIATFTVAATSGDRVRLHVVPTASGRGPSLSTNLLSPAGAVTCAASTVDNFDCTIPATGTYTATVRDFSGTGTGTYAITPQRLTNPVGCGSLTLGATTAGTLTAGAMTCHRIVAAAGDRLRLHTVATAAGASAPATSADLISPAGAVLCSLPSAGDLDCPVPAAGTYTTTVSDFYGYHPGPYAVSPQRLTDPVGCGSIAIGGSASATIGPGTVSCFRVTSTAGRALKVASSTTSLKLAPAADVVSPAGTLTCPARTGTFTCTAPAAGTYTITVRDFYGYQTGPFTLALS